MYRSFFINSNYKAAPPMSQIPEGAEDIQEFETLELLQVSPEYIAYVTEQNDGFNQDERNWQNDRDRLQNSAVVLFDGHLFDMSPESSAKIVGVRESLKRRNKTISWRCKDATTLGNARYDLSRQDIDDISDAVIDANEAIDLEAVTGFPVDPWPLEV